MVHAQSPKRRRTGVQVFNDSEGRILPACSTSTLHVAFKSIRKKIVNLELHSPVTDVNQDMHWKTPCEPT